MNPMAIRPDEASHDVTDTADLYSTRTEREIEAVDGGTLVWTAEYEKRRSGWVKTTRHLQAVVVTDREAMRAELSRRGIGVGALHHKTAEEVEIR